MKNSEWFWLAVCTTFFSIGSFCWFSLWYFELEGDSGFGLFMSGFMLLFSSIGYFAFQLHKPFNDWLDSL